MKIYTEHQVRGAHIKGILKGRFGTTIPSGDLADLYINELTPIEIPSDEEIGKDIGSGMHDYYKAGFIEGAKWMKEQILNQIK